MQADERIHRADTLSAHDCFGARLSDNSERLYESDNCVLGDLTGARQRAEAERLNPK